MNKLLVVIDMVNGFVSSGALADPKMKRIVPKLVELIDEYLQNEEKVFFVRDAHDVGVSNAIPNKNFENIFPTENIIREILK